MSDTDENDEQDEQEQCDDQEAQDAHDAELQEHDEHGQDDEQAEQQQQQQQYSNLVDVAKMYSDATRRCRALGEKVKSLRDAKLAVGEEMMQAFEDARVDVVKLDDGTTVKRFVAKSAEKIDEDYMQQKLCHFLNQQTPGNRKRIRDPTPQLIASAATKFIDETREVDEQYRLSIRNPPKPKSKPNAKTSKTAKSSKQRSIK